MSVSRLAEHMGLPRVLVMLRKYIMLREHPPRNDLILHSLLVHSPQYTTFV
jgi:hypothetical protein